jgi:hypothetical protein
VARSHEPRPAEVQRSAKPVPSGWAPAPGAGRSGKLTPSPAQAVALQHAVGNRAAARALARWAAHPDKDKKGELMTDAAAAEYLRFNSPKNE